MCAGGGEARCLVCRGGVLRRSVRNQQLKNHSLEYQCNSEAESLQQRSSSGLHCIMEAARRHLPNNTTSTAIVVLSLMRLDCAAKTVNARL